jgi:DNA/RNA endonuclease YhcR with UshA esterase domain
VDIRNAGPQVGKSGCVAGLVLRVYSARTGNTFLDFCQDYRTCPFTSVIFASDKNKFGDLGSLQGKRVEIRGDVVTYQGRAEIIISDPQQVRSAP